MSESALLTSVTLSSQVKNHILNLIAEQKLTPGMPVPSEIQLIQKLGVSRGGLSFTCRPGDSGNAQR